MTTLAGLPGREPGFPLKEADPWSRRGLPCTCAFLPLISIPRTQRHDLEQLARQRGLEITRIYEDRISGASVSRPRLDQMMADARQGKFNVVLVWTCDRLARSVINFLQVLDEFGRLNIEFISFREQIDTRGALGRVIPVIS